MLKVVAKGRTIINKQKELSAIICYGTSWFSANPTISYTEPASLWATAGNFVLLQNFKNIAICRLPGRAITLQ